MEEVPEPPSTGRLERSPTPEEIGLISQSIREGNYREVAAQWAGVPVRTFQRWCQKGRKTADESSPYWRLWRAVLEAERAAEMAMVELVVKAAQGDAMHARWWLERKCPQRWAGNRVELRDLKRRMDEFEKEKANAKPPAPVATQAGSTDATVADQPSIVEPRPGS